MSDILARERGPSKTVAAIDIGSNSVRMVIAQVSEDGSFEVLERATKPVRLGHSTFVSGRLSQNTMNATIGILRDYRKLIDTYRVDTIHAVATSAVREAANRDAFLDRVTIATDLSIEIIEPAEESRLTVSAVREVMGNAHGINRGRTLIVEIGGGSGLLTMLEDGEIALSESCNLGAIRLQELLDTAQETPERAVDLLHRHIDNVVSALRRTLPLSGVRSLVAVGGDARFAARQVGRPGAKPEVHLVAREDFESLVDRCLPESVESLARKYRLPFADAETLVPALLGYRSVWHATHAKWMIVSSVSMRDGLLLDVARHVTGQEDPELARSVLHAAESVGEKYRYDADHARQVADLAVTLFDELKAEHRLGRRHRLLLQVSALLHEVGGFVSSRAHHKHSYYLLLNSPIYGLRGKEQELVAHIARYHRRSMPKLSHLDYMALRREYRVIVNKLAAILRVADALDRGHSRQIKEMRFERRSGELVVCIPGVRDLSLERRAMARKADMFEDIYGLKVRLEEEG